MTYGRVFFSPSTDQRVDLVDLLANRGVLSPSHTHLWNRKGESVDMKAFGKLLVLVSLIALGFGVACDDKKAEEPAADAPAAAEGEKKEEAAPAEGEKKEEAAPAEGEKKEEAAEGEKKEGEGAAAEGEKAPEAPPASQ